MPRGKRKRGVAPKAPSPEIYDTIVVKAPQAAPVKPAVSQNELPQPVTLSKCTPGVAAAEGKSASSTPAREGKNALATPAREGRRTRRTPVRGGNSTPTSQAEPTAANIKPGRTRKQLIVEKNGSPLAKKISENEQSQLLGTGDQASGTSDVGLQQHDMMEQEQVTIIGGTNDKTGEQLEGSSERSLQLLASETLAVKTSSGTMRTPNIPGIPLNGDQLLDIHMSQYQQEESDGVDTQKSGVAPVGTMPDALVNITESTDSTTLSSTNYIGPADLGLSVSFNSHKDHDFTHLATEVEEEYQQVQEAQGTSSVPQALTNGFGGLVGNVSAEEIDATQRLITAPIVLDNSTGDTLQDAPVQTEVLVTALETSQISSSAIFTHKTKKNEPTKVNVQPTANNEVETQTEGDFINSDQGAVSGLSKDATHVSISSAIEDQGLPVIDAKNIFAENPRSTPEEAPIEPSDLALASPLVCFEDLDENTGALRRTEVLGDLGRQIISSDNILSTNLGATSNKVHIHLSKDTVTGLNDHEIAPSIEEIMERHNSPFVASIELLQSPSKSTNDDICIELQKITAPALSISSISEVEDNFAPSLKKITENSDIPMVEAYGTLPENSVTTEGATAITFPSRTSTMLDDNGNLSSKEVSEGLNVPMAGSGDVLPNNTLSGYISNFLKPHTNTDNHGVTNPSVLDSENRFVSTSKETDTQSLSPMGDESELLVKVGDYKISSSNGQGFQEDLPVIYSVNTPLSNSGLTTENISLNDNISIPLLLPPISCIILKPPPDVSSETSPGTSNQVPLRYISTADTLETFQVGDSSGRIPNSEFEQTLQTETEIKNSPGEEDNPRPSDNLEEGHVSLAMDTEEEFEHNELWALDLSLNMFSESDEEEDDEGAEEQEGEEEEGGKEEREEEGR